MDDLITWLRAQLDDDERIAREAGGACWSVGTEETSDGENAYYSIGAHGEEPFEFTDTSQGDKFDHMARHDPARVLREVEAKRQIIEQYELAGDGLTGEILRNCLDTPIRLLALPHAGHPDYDESWRP